VKMWPGQLDGNDGTYVLLSYAPYELEAEYTVTSAPTGDEPPYFTLQHLYNLTAGNKADKLTSSYSKKLYLNGVAVDMNSNATKAAWGFLKPVFVTVTTGLLSYIPPVTGYIVCWVALSPQILHGVLLYDSKVTQSTLDAATNSVVLG